MSHIANFISAIKVGVSVLKRKLSIQKGPKFLINLIKAIYGEGLVLTICCFARKFFNYNGFFKA